MAAASTSTVPQAAPFVDERDPEFMARFVDTVLPLLEAYFRPTVRGLERIPQGPGMYVGNHNAGTLMPEVFIFGGHLFKTYGLAQCPFALGHDLAVNAPVFKKLLPKIGAVRANRENADRIFQAGHKVLVYPGGELDAMRAFRDRNRIIFGSRRGYIRMALKHGVPIIPVVTAGAHETFRVLTDGRWLAKRLRLDRLMRIEVLPITLSLPWGITLGPVFYFPFRTRILIEVLDPIRFDRSGEAAAADADYVESCHRMVHGTMEAALTRLAAEREEAIAADKAAKKKTTSPRR